MRTYQDAAWRELTWNTFRDHLILEYEIPKYDGDLGAPNVFVPLDEPIVEEKLRLLREHYQATARQALVRRRALPRAHARPRHGGGDPIRRGVHVPRSSPSSSHDLPRDRHRRGLGGRARAHEDERGFFARTWDTLEFAGRGLSGRLVQCSVSFNRRRGTLRGLHYQVAPHEEAKLVRCTMGAVFDVAVDLRSGSTTLCHWVGVELSAENGLALYAP